MMHATSEKRVEGGMAQRHATARTGKAVLLVTGISMLFTGLLLVGCLSWSGRDPQTVDSHRITRLDDDKEPFEPVRDFNVAVPQPPHILQDVSDIGKLTNSIPVIASRSESTVEGRLAELPKEENRITGNYRVLRDDGSSLTEKRYPDWVYEVINSEPVDNEKAEEPSAAASSVNLAVLPPSVSNEQPAEGRTPGGKVVYNIGLDETTPYPDEQRVYDAAVVKHRYKRQPDELSRPQYEDYSDAPADTSDAHGKGSNEVYDYYEDEQGESTERPRADEQKVSAVEGDYYNYYGESRRVGLEKRSESVEPRHHPPPPEQSVSVAPGDAKNGYTPSYDYDDAAGEGEDDDYEEDDGPLQSGPDYVEIGDEDLAYDASDEEVPQRRRVPPRRGRRRQPVRRPQHVGKTIRRPRRPPGITARPRKRPAGKMAFRRAAARVLPRKLTLPARQRGLPARQRPQIVHQTPQLGVGVRKQLVARPGPLLQPVPQPMVRPGIDAATLQRLQQLRARLASKYNGQQPQGLADHAVLKMAQYAVPAPSPLGVVPSLDVDQKPYYLNSDAEGDLPQINVIVNPPAPTNEPTKDTQDGSNNADELDSLLKQYNLLKNVVEYLKNQQAKDQSTNAQSTSYLQPQQNLLLLQQQQQQLQQQRQLQQQQQLEQQRQQLLLQQQRQQQQQQQQQRLQQARPSQTKYVSPSLSPIYSQRTNEIPTNVANQVVDMLASAIMDQRDSNTLLSTNPSLSSSAVPNLSASYGNFPMSPGVQSQLQSSSRPVPNQQISYASPTATRITQGTQLYGLPVAQQPQQMVYANDPSALTQYPSTVGRRVTYGVPSSNTAQSSGVIQPSYQQVQYQNQPATLILPAPNRFMATLSPNALALMYSKQGMAKHGPDLRSGVSGLRYPGEGNQFVRNNPPLQPYRVHPTPWQQ